jgi:peptidoglycan/LPS O-acetylase OafA/YrhL
MARCHAAALVTSSRDRPLDGLRGVAALIVFTGHLFVVNVPSLANGALAGSTIDVSVPAYALLYTPLHIVWAGAEAVTVFFVLSGYVLALPYVRGETFRASFYPRRLLRLYLPVWGALCLTALVHVAIVRGAGGAATWWLDSHSDQITGGDVRDSVLLLHGAGNYSLLAVLWSLHWEVVFSLLLPLFLLVGRATRRVAPVVALVALGTLAVHGPHDTPRYLPLFLLGTLIAYQQHRVERWRLTLAGGGRRAHLVEGLLLTIAVLGLTSVWWLRIGHYALVGHHTDYAYYSVPVLVALGACAALVLALIGPATRGLLSTRPMQWTGTRSYTLYLVHEPVLVGIAFALGGAPEFPLLALVAIPAVLLVTEGFYRTVERPSHELARRSGAFVARLRRA